MSVHRGSHYLLCYLIILLLSKNLKLKLFYNSETLESQVLSMFLGIPLVKHDIKC